MTDSLHPECLAIDGGGSHCRFVLAAGEEFVTATGGPANVSTDFDGAMATILSGLSDLAAQAGRSVDRLADCPAFVGLAGVTGSAMVARLQAALPLRTVRYADDRPAALRGALGGEDGFVAHCGTGSFLAAQAGGEMRLAGGWGPVLGDEGSAQMLGRRLLWAVLQHVDGFRPATPLTDAVLARFGDAAGIVRFAGSAGPTELGALAPMVTEAARSGDATAGFLLEEAAALVASELRKLGWAPGLAICLTGGIGPHYAPYLPDEMRNDVRDAEAEPIEGAIALARDLAREHGA